MTPVQIMLAILDVLLEGADLLAAIDRLAAGMATRAEQAGRDVTPEESAIIRELREESAKRRRGESLTPREG